MRTVAIYRTEILPLSETFVRDQALALRRWHPVLVGERDIDALPLEGLESRAPRQGPATFLQKIHGVVTRKINSASPQIMRVMRRLRPALIHAHFGFDGVEAWPIARRLNIPLVVTLHGSDITTYMRWFAEGRTGRRWKNYPAKLSRLGRWDRVWFVAVSGHIRDAAIAAGLPADRVVVRHIGLDPKKFTPSGASPGQRKPVILFLGRLVEKKGARYLLEAFERVRKVVPEARLLIAGDGPEAPSLKEKAGNDPAVEFLGAVPRETVIRLMTEARVFCLPSVTAESGDAEGLPLVLLEAQASGVPVVTSARGGTTEGILDGETGFAFPERDVDALTKHLEALLTDDALADRMGAAGPEFIATKQNIHLCTEKLEELYDRAVAAP
ncbi:glycosyltransferase [Kozakia baliensis]|uniref:glycosyltransferase n=1 Tax=Kozakia baliensis TaxID=153496 RepID=UPI00345BAA7A